MNIISKILEVEINKGNASFYTEELKNKMNKTTKNGVPLSLFMLSHEYCDGLCMEMAYEMTRLIEDGIYVRGNINEYPIRKEPNHAWVENDEFVYDTTDGIIYKKDFYYDYYEAEATEKITKEEIETQDKLSFYKSKDKEIWNLKEVLAYIKVTKELELQNPEHNTQSFLEAVEQYIDSIKIEKTEDFTEEIEEWNMFYSYKR